MIQTDDPEFNPKTLIEDLTMIIRSLLCLLIIGFGFTLGFLMESFELGSPSSWIMAIGFLLFIISFIYYQFKIRRL